MKRIIRGWMCLGGVCIVVGVVLDSCAAPAAQTAAANAAYAAQIGDCVRTAASLDAGVACMDKVDEAWGLRDAGGK